MPSVSSCLRFLDDNLFVLMTVLVLTFWVLWLTGLPELPLKRSYAGIGFLMLSASAIARYQSGESLLYPTKARVAAGITILAIVILFLAF